jgi:hypothetical protein
MYMYVLCLGSLWYIKMEEYIYKPFGGGGMIDFWGGLAPQAPSNCAYAISVFFLTPFNQYIYKYKNILLNKKDF